MLQGISAPSQVSLIESFPDDFMTDTIAIFPSSDQTVYFWTPLHSSHWSIIFWALLEGWLLFSFITIIINCNPLCEHINHCGWYSSNYNISSNNINTTSVTLTVITLKIMMYAMLKVTICISLLSMNRVCAHRF